EEVCPLLPGQTTGSQAGLQPGWGGGVLSPQAPLRLALGTPPRPQIPATTQGSFKQVFPVVLFSRTRNGFARSVGRSVGLWRLGKNRFPQETLKEIQISEFGKNSSSQPGALSSQPRDALR
ncbi:unnamed protein product, partial [Gulo gulo]